MSRHYQRDGKAYTFDSERLKREYNARGNGKNRGFKSSFIKQLASATDRDAETVKTWVKGSSNPNDLGLVEIIERVLGLPSGSLLLPVTVSKPEPIANDNQGGAEMYRRGITEKQREVAHALYCDLCDMIYFVTDSLGIMDFDPNDPSAACSDNNNEVQPHDFSNQEEYREKLILNIRKSGLYIPLDLRNRITDLVNCAFGPWDAEYNDMFYNGEEYKTYLTANGWKDAPDKRFTYSRNFRENLYRDLDSLFHDYAC